MTLFLNPFSTFIIVAFLFLQNYQCEAAVDCPPDCICFEDLLSNLGSWKWIETDIITPRDEDNPNFNPYLDHNEVFENPQLAWKKLKKTEETLKSVTCIIRKDEPTALASTLDRIPSETQVMSILQAPGSANLTLTKELMSKFGSLIGLELQGVTLHDGHTSTNVFRLSANALAGHDKLRYLNLHKVLLEQATVTPPTQEDVYIKVRRVDGENEDMDSMDNDIQPRLLYLGIREKNEEDNKILPYSEYMKERGGDNSGSGGPKLSPGEKQGEPKIAVAFTQLSKLVHLRISGCSMLDISWDMFYKLSSLKYLLLDNNDLLFLPDFVFYATPNLTALSLAGNRILNLQTVGLAGLLYLEKLDVTNNNITHLSELSLPPFPHLQVADFRFNPIETIFPNTFEVMNTTKSLFLGNPNSPLEFFANSFYGLISLTRLDILNVRIAKLEGPMLRGMPELESLTMDGYLPTISYDAFTEVPKLQKIILKKCQLRKISMDTFYGLSALTELDLSYNDLEILPPGVFDEQTSLRELYLQHNKLKTVPATLFSRLPAQLIRLEGNPWHCSCEMVNWDSKVTNVIRRYYVQKNTTDCDYKGNNCDHGKPTFATKYVFEKRVSPICLTPAKFMKKSVFQIQRKELSHCVTVKKVKKLTKKKNSLNQSDNVASLPAKVPKKTMTTVPPTTKIIANKTIPTETTGSSTTTATTPAILRSSSDLLVYTSQGPSVTEKTGQPLDLIPTNEPSSQVQTLTAVVAARLKTKAARTLPFSFKNNPTFQLLSSDRSRAMGNSTFFRNPSISKKSLKLAKLQKSLRNRQF